jgi:hypothetical protein
MAYWYVLVDDPASNSLASSALMNGQVATLAVEVMRHTGFAGGSVILLLLLLLQVLCLCF